MQFTHQDFSHVNFNGKVLTNANFEGSTFFFTSLKRCTLNYARFMDTDLLNTRFDNAYMEFTALNRVSAKSTTFKSANLRRSTLDGAIFTDCDLSGANLSNVSMVNGKFSNCNFSGAFLVDTNLQGANLSNCSLHRAVLLGADLSGAILDHAVLTKCRVSVKQLSKVSSMVGTVFNPDECDGEATKDELLFLRNYHISNALLKEAETHATELGIRPIDFIEGLIIKSLCS